MSRVLNVSGNILTVLFYIFMLYGEIFGIIHSVRKHSTGDAIASVIIPPWAWYRSLELFWHDDFADVNWDKRLSLDMKTCVYFVSKSVNGDTNKFELNEDLESFSEKVAKYPQDKREYLLNGTRSFIAYSKLLTEDFINSLSSFEDTGSFNITHDEKTKAIEAELMKYSLVEEVNYARKYFDDLNREMKLKLTNDGLNLYATQLRANLIKIKEYQIVQDKEYRDVLQALFNEGL